MLQTCLLIFTTPIDEAIRHQATVAPTATEAWSNMPLPNLHPLGQIYKGSKRNTELEKVK
jgi:hypothetical protein